MELPEEEPKTEEVESGKIEKMKVFMAGAEGAVRTRRATIWWKWRELGLVINNNIPLNNRGIEIVH